MGKSQIFEKHVKNMSLEQKIGQCLVIGYVGTVITPEILKRIKKYTPAGIRVGVTMRVKSALHDPYAYNQDCLDRVLRQPKGTVKDFRPGLPPPFCSNEEYCEFLNTLKEAALNNGLGIPVHITMDMEGDVSCDYPRGGITTFPSCMGQSVTGNTRSAYNAAWGTARQLRALGVNWIHSPVLDTNTEPLNREIGVRSYGETADQVIPYALEALNGFRDAGMITTGKHFPGRGSSTQDAHHGLPVIDISREEMEEHLKPFQALIDAGIPCIMTAHTAYPTLDPSGMPATLSKPILTDLLKGKMGFQGCITTDDITMGGIVQKFQVADACVEALNAGADLILLRDESPLIDDVFAGMVQAVKSGKLPEDRLDDAICRTLKAKYEYGLFENGNINDPAKASDGINDPKVAKSATEIAEKCVRILRDENGILPLKPETKVLLVEQINGLHERINSQQCHPGIFWEKMLACSENVGMVETAEKFTAEDHERVLRRIGEADVLVITNYLDRRSSDGNAFVKELHNCGKPIVVVTNSPYPLTVMPDYKTVICTYGVSPDCLNAAAKKIYGK